MKYLFLTLFIGSNLLFGMEIDSLDDDGRSVSGRADEEVRPELTPAELARKIKQDFEDGNFDEVGFELNRRRKWPLSPEDTRELLDRAVKLRPKYKGDAKYVDLNGVVTVIQVRAGKGPTAASGDRAPQEFNLDRISSPRKSSLRSYGVPVGIGIVGLILLAAGIGTYVIRSKKQSSR